jgi:hypothetical protein
MVISIDPMVMISPSQGLWYFAATTMATGNDWKPESKWRHCQGETFASVLAQERAQNKSRERDAFLSFRLWLLPLCKVIIDIFFWKYVDTYGFQTRRCVPFITLGNADTAIISPWLAHVVERSMMAWRLDGDSMRLGNVTANIGFVTKTGAKQVTIRTFQRKKNMWCSLATKMGDQYERRRCCFSAPGMVSQASERLTCRDLPGGSTSKQEIGMKLLLSNWYVWLDML